MLGNVIKKVIITVNILLSPTPVAQKKISNQNNNIIINRIIQVHKITNQGVRAKKV